MNKNHDYHRKVCGRLDARAGMMDGRLSAKYKLVPGWPTDA